MAYPGDATDLPPDARRALQLVAEGLGAGAIADRLGWTVPQLAAHLADAVRAVAARSVSDAVDIARRRGLLESPAA